MRRELRPMLTLAGPVIAAEVGWLLMGIVDTIMVGPLGPSAIGAVGAGTILFLTVIMIGFGMLLALDTFVAQSFGAGRIDECHRWLVAGVQLAAVLSVVLMVVSLGGVMLLPLVGFHPDVLALLQPYMTHLVWSTPPLLAYVVFRRYLQAMNLARPVMIALVLANLTNVVACWVLIYGKLGMPALGVVGAAYATVFSRLVMAVFLLVVIVYRERATPSGLRDIPFAIDWPRIQAIVRLGSPAAGQILLEVGVFAAASALAATIAPAAVAAHQIVLNVVGLIFMVPYGLGTAAAVRVGQAVGRRDPDGVRAAGWTALALATATMVCSAVLFTVAPRLLLYGFTSDTTVLEVGVSLFLVASVFQLFDGIQTVTTGALRGLGNTKTPMLVNLVGHWGIGLPIAWALCFHWGWGVRGLWAGLAIGLILIGSTLLQVW
ncbi:MAG TPA: MATE family efflux transporter, partial [Vicinamibacterales bacterium]|nr:MATE family efflux transporter [Vicinamibacterales bacterium]